MKKRLAKKIEKMRRKKVHEALEIVLEINTTQARNQSATGRKPTVFFYFSGHTTAVDISVIPSGWTRGYDSLSDIDVTGYADSKVSMDRMMKRLANKKKELQDAGKM